MQQSKYNPPKYDIRQRRSLEKPNSRKSNALNVLIIAVRAWMHNSEFHDSLSDRAEIYMYKCTPLNTCKQGMKASDRIVDCFITFSPLSLVIVGVYLLKRPQSTYVGCLS